MKIGQICRLGRKGLNSDTVCGIYGYRSGFPT